MTRHEYLDELNTHLMSLSTEERENAVKFYEEYFEDAGPDKEQEVIEELGKPFALAKSIICEQSAYSKSLSYAQYRASKAMNNPEASPAAENIEIDTTPDIMPDGSAQEKPHTQYTSYYNDQPQGHYDNSYEAYKENYNNDNYNDPKPSANTSYNSNSSEAGRVIVIILLIFFGIPALITIVTTFAALGIASIACFAAAVVTTIVGFVHLAYSFGEAMILLGASMICGGLGFLLSIPALLGLFKFVPWLVKTVTKSLKKSTEV